MVDTKILTIEDVEITNSEIVGPSIHVLDAMRFLGEQYQPQTNSEVSKKRLEKSIATKKSMFTEYALEATGSSTTLDEMNRYQEVGDAITQATVEISQLCVGLIAEGVEPTFYSNVREELFGYLRQFSTDKTQNRQIIYKMRHFSRLAKPWEPEESLESTIEIEQIEQFSHKEAETTESFKSAISPEALKNLEMMANIMIINRYIETGVKVKPESEIFFKTVIKGMTGESQDSDELSDEVRKKGIKSIEGIFDLLASKLEFGLALYDRQEELGYKLEVDEEAIPQIKSVRSLVFGYKRLLAISHAVEFVDAINTHNDQESLEILASLEDSPFSYSSAIQEIARIQGEKITKHTAKKDEYISAVDLTDELIKLVPEFTPTEKELKEQLDDDLMSDLLVMEYVNLHGELSEAEILELKNSPEIQNEVARLNELDANSRLNYGLELEVDDDLDRSSVESLKESIVSKYAGVKNQREALQYLQNIGVPIDEDCLGEVSLPYSQGYHRQLRAMKILQETGIIPERVTVHVNLSGIKNPAEKIDDILIGTLGVISTNKFGTLDISDGDGFAIGFPEHSQKALIHDPEADVRGNNNYPHGLPVLIEGDRVELRGISIGDVTLQMLEEGMPDIERVFTEIADDSHGRGSDWAETKRELVELISPIAFPESDPSFVELFSTEYFERAVQAGTVSRDSLPLERYLAALKLYTHVNSTIFESQFSQTEVVDAAMSDPGFINHLLNFEGKIPEDAKLVEHIDRYYAENRSFEVQGKFYSTKTWEFMRGRVSYAAASNQDLVDQIAAII